jgi:hypothetical protein
MISGLDAGTYSVIPQSQGYWFAPAGQAVTLTADQFGVDFTASLGSLLNLANSSNSLLSLQIAGPGGESCVIQSSSDLIHWTSILTNTFGPTNSLELLVPPNEPSLFYRALTP